MLVQNNFWSQHTNETKPILSKRMIYFYWCSLSESLWYKLLCCTKDFLCGFYFINRQMKHYLCIKCHLIIVSSILLNICKINCFETNALLNRIWALFDLTMILFSSVLTFKLRANAKLNYLKLNCFWHWNCTYIYLNIELLWNFTV